MAEGKVRFYVYTEWKQILDDFNTEQKALWLDWLFDYVNDNNPLFPDDPLVKMFCKITKTQLKKDLQSWEDERQKRSEAGKKGMAVRWNNNDNTDNNVITNDNKNNNVINAITNITDKNRLDKTRIDKNRLDIDTHTNACVREEEENIEALQNFLTEIETMLNKVITGKNCDIACKMYEKYGKDKTLYEIKNNLDKNNPILYAYKVLESEKVKKGYNDDLLLEDEWLKEFNERTRQDEEQRKKELRNED